MLNIEDKIKKATMNIMISNGLKIIGVIMYRFKIIISDKMPDHALAYVAWRRSKDGITIIPTINISQDCESLSVGQITFIIVHEIMHVINDHGNRGMDKDDKIFNFAADHVINNVIVKESKNNKLVEDMEDRVLFDDWKNENLTTEDVYDRLMQKAKKIKINNICTGCGGEIVIDADIDGKNVKITVSPDPNGDSKAAKQIAGELKADIRSLLDSDLFAKLRGSGNNALVEYLDGITKIRIPWHKLLEKAIKSSVVVVSENRSWKNLNRRMRTRGIMMPSHPKDDSSRSNLYVLVDNSGSISSEDLKKFGDILLCSIPHFNVIRVLKHSVDINEDIIIDSCMDPDEIVKGVGRGGTAHDACFDLIEHEFESLEDDTEIGLVLMLTDYQSNIEQIWNKYNWVKSIPVKVVLTDPIKVADYVDDDPIVIQDIK